jgi:hypothetical protein
MEHSQQIPQSEAVNTALSGAMAAAMGDFMVRTYNNVNMAFVKSTIAHIKIDNVLDTADLEASFAKFWEFPFIKDNKSLFAGINLKTFSEIYQELDILEY